MVTFKCVDKKGLRRAYERIIIMLVLSGDPS